MLLQIFVFFPEASKVGVKDIKDITEEMKKENVDRAIMVVSQNLTPFARTVINELSGKQVGLSRMHHDHLAVDMMYPLQGVAAFKAHHV